MKKGGNFNLRVLAVRQGMRVGLEAGQGSFGMLMDGEDVRQTMRGLDLRVGLVEQGELSLDPAYRSVGFAIHAIAMHSTGSNAAATCIVVGCRLPLSALCHALCRIGFC